MLLAEVSGLEHNWGKKTKREQCSRNIHQRNSQNKIK